MRCPTRRLLHGFLGYLWEQPSFGGGTAMAYFVSLPQALRIAQGRLTVSFAIPPELRRMAAKGKRVLPAVTPLKRDPASMPVIASLVRDASLPRDLRTAVLFQYVTGLRPGNVYRNSHNARLPQRMVQWKHVSVCSDQVGTFVAITLPIRKTSEAPSVNVTHLFTSSPDPVKLPCPVKWFRQHQQLCGVIQLESPVFTRVTAAAVSKALKKHAPDGQYLAPHSVRIGAASDRLMAGAGVLEIMKLGEWSHTKTALRYCRWTPDAVRAQFVKLTTSAPCPGASSGSGSVHDGRQLIRDQKPLTVCVRRQSVSPYLFLLQVPMSNSTARIFLYDKEGKRCTGRVGNARKQHYFLVSTAAEFRRLDASSCAVRKAAVQRDILQDLVTAQSGAAGRAALCKARPFVRRVSGGS